MSKKESTAVAEVEQKTTALAVGGMDFAADAGAGMEGAGQESFAIPFLSVLQKGSPQVDEASGAAIEGAKAGMLFENVTGRMFSGKDGVVIVPCSYKREFLRWGARDNGGGFKGAYTPEDVADMRSKGEIVELEGRLYAPEADGSVSDKKSDRFNDTRNHYVLILDQETGAWAEALLSLSSTQIKKSKALMSALASVKLKNAAGQMYTPPTFANMVRVTTVGESNDKGTWFGVKFELAGQVDRAEIYAAAKAFHANIAKGGVQVRYEEAPEETGSATSTASGF
jgi:hypothetical protein